MTKGRRGRPPKISDVTHRHGMSRPRQLREQATPDQMKHARKIAALHRVVDVATGKIQRRLGIRRLERPKGKPEAFPMLSLEPIARVPYVWVLDTTKEADIDSVSNHIYGSINRYKSGAKDVVERTMGRYRSEKKSRMGLWNTHEAEVIAQLIKEEYLYPVRVEPDLSIINNVESETAETVPQSNIAIETSGSLKSHGHGIAVDRATTTSLPRGISSDGPRYQTRSQCQPAAASNSASRRLCDNMNAADSDGSCLDPRAPAIVSNGRAEDTLPQTRKTNSTTERSLNELLRVTENAWKSQKNLLEQHCEELDQLRDRESKLKCLLDIKEVRCEELRKLHDETLNDVIERDGKIARLEDEAMIYKTRLKYATKSTVAKRLATIYETPGVLEAGKYKRFGGTSAEDPIVLDE
ncbi:hypothetical protein ABW21_db0204936 [Orbilia brochopaga]|nr:hypothetical protein ABW21_db0204936 [Drechslerella brochopaga]